MATLTNTSGTVTQNISFAEIITAGVVTTFNLPATINQTIAYLNGTTAGSVDLIYAKQLTLSATPTTIDFTSVADLNQTSQTWARVREFIVQNLSSTGDLKVYANSTSGVTWLPNGSVSPILARAATSASPSAGGVVRISDPLTTGATSGNYVAASSSKLVLDPGANSLSVNVIAVGCSSVS